MCNAIIVHALPLSQLKEHLPSCFESLFEWLGLFVLRQNFLPKLAREHMERCDLFLAIACRLVLDTRLALDDRTIEVVYIPYLNF